MDHNNDDFFENSDLRNHMQLGTALPKLGRLASGATAVVFIVRESDGFISRLNKPKFCIRYGEFTVGDVRVLKLMLLVLISETTQEHCLAEMCLNWHDEESSRGVIDGLAAGSPMIVRFYGDDWKCKRAIGLPAEAELSRFAKAFSQEAEESWPWSFDEFTDACQQLADRYDLQEQWLVTLPEQMTHFSKTGEFMDEPESQIFDQLNSRPESAEERRSRHQQFIKSQYPQLAAFAWGGYQEEGRGTLLITKNGEGSQAMYLSADNIDPKAESSPLPQIMKYNPETEIVVTIDDDGSCSTSYVVRIPSLPPPAAHETLKPR